MLLYRSRGQTRVEPAERRWLALLAEAAAAAQTTLQGQQDRRDRGAGRREKQQQDETQRRAERAMALAHLGEMSAAASALQAAPLAPANQATWEALRDPSKRSRERQVPLPAWLADFRPDDGPRDLSADRLFANLRGARRGAAAGPSGTTAEHLRVLLDEEEGTDLFHHADSCLVQGLIPSDVVAGLRIGRMVALTKPSGGVRALVMGDVFRRLVSRTCAQQAGEAFQVVCAPFLYALTKAGAEALARELNLATESGSRTTVFSVDGVGAYDHIARAAIFEGLRRDARLEALIPFVYYDADGGAHTIEQAEGGKQGDPLMPGLYAVGVHGALMAANASLAQRRGALRFLG